MDKNQHRGDHRFSETNDKTPFPRSIADDNYTVTNDKTNGKTLLFSQREDQGNTSKYEAPRDGHDRTSHKCYREQTGDNTKRRRIKSPPRSSRSVKNDIDPGSMTTVQSAGNIFGGENIYRLDDRVSQATHPIFTKYDDVIVRDGRRNDNTLSMYSQGEYQRNKCPAPTESESLRNYSRNYENESAQRILRDGQDRIGRKRHRELHRENVKRKRKNSPHRTSPKNRSGVNLHFEKTVKSTDNRFCEKKRDLSFRLEDCVSCLNEERVMMKLQELLEKDSSDVVSILLSEKRTFRNLLSTAPRRKICVFLKIVRILIHSLDCESATSMVSSVIGETKDKKYLEKLTLVVQDRINEEMGPCLELMKNILECVIKICNMNPSDKIYILGICDHMKGSVQQISEKIIEADMSEINTLLNILEDIKSQCMKPNKPDVKMDPHEDITVPTFRELSVYPTTADIHAEIDPYLRPIKAKGEYANLDQYLDTHFRLLREDFMIPLRDGIRNYINGTNGRKKKKFDNIRVYENARILHPVCCESGVNYLIAFDVSKLKHIRWAIGKRLKYGSLLCLSSDRFSTCFYAIVDDSNYKDRSIGLVTVKFVEDTSAFGNLSGKLFQFAESTVYFESVCHVLACLQRMNDIPFTDYVLKCKKEILPPKYLRKNPHRTVDLSPILKMTKERSFEAKYLDSKPKNVTLLVDPWPDASRLCLNETQSKAVMSALTREFCVIQGPPGCGKTYVGLKIVELLICNRWLWQSFRSSPILLLCYTNHALDQFMEGVLKFSEGILRIGGRSRSDVLEPYNLKNIRQSNRKEKQLPFHLHKMSKVARKEKHLLVERNPSLLFRALRQNILNERCLRREMGEQIYKQFKIQEKLQQRKQNYHNFPFLGKSVIVEWLGIHKMFEDISSKENTEDFELNTESLMDSEDSNISNFYVQELKNKHVALDLDEVLLQSKNKDENTRKQRLVNEIRRRLLCSNEKVSTQENVFIPNLSVDKRWQLYRTWVNSYCDKQMPKLVKFSREFNNACQICNEERQLEDKSIMQGASLIGMTTTCGAKYQAVLKEIKPKIIIVEEAAEIVESHIIANLTKDCEQLILIGDHKQLRPKLNVYKLEKEFNLDISLFERMVKNGVAFECLDTQHRMRPEIAEPLRFIYNGLKNHESVLLYDNIKGVGKNLFLINHNNQESNDSEISSFKNVHEAEYVAALYKYLRQQGYSHTDITVLTTYKGQLYCLKKLFFQSNEKLLENALLKTVDDYQGEENRILVVSLVRSNEESRIGFLKEENRVCVALSRAKEGLYVVGNFDNLKKNSNLWRKITEQVQINDCFGSALPLYCQNHPETITKAEKALDFQRVPNGGCREVCNIRLPCGHSCDKFCHVDDKDHTEALCPKRCERRCENNHTCKLRCHEPCFCTENIKVKFPDCFHEMSFPCGTEEKDKICTHECGIYLKCGHMCSKRCDETCNPCVVMVDVVFEICGHSKRVECNQRDSKDCPVACGLKLKCGHACKERCDKDIHTSESNFNSCTKGHRSDCKEMCGKTLPCGHICSGKCNQCLLMNSDVTCVIHKKCTDCNPKCEHKCSRKSDKYVPCTEKCRSKMNYHICNRLVSQLPKTVGSDYLYWILCTEMLEEDFTVGNIYDFIKEIHRSIDLYIFNQFNEIPSIRYMLDRFIATIRNCVDYNDTERNHTFKFIKRLCDKTYSQVDNIHFVVLEHDVLMRICKRLHYRETLLPDLPGIDIKESVNVHLGIRSKNICVDKIQKQLDYEETSNNENTVETHEQTSLIYENSNYRPTGADVETLLVESKTRASAEKDGINNINNSNSDLSDEQFSYKENDNEVEKEEPMSVIPKKKSSEDENQVVSIRTIKIPFAKQNGIQECSCYQVRARGVPKREIQEHFSQNNFALKRKRPGREYKGTEIKKKVNEGDTLRSDKHNNFIDENNFRKRKNNEERPGSFENTCNQKKHEHLNPSDLRHRLQKKRRYTNSRDKAEQSRNNIEMSSTNDLWRETIDKRIIKAERECGDCNGTKTATVKNETDEEDDDWLVLDELSDSE